MDIFSDKRIYMYISTCVHNDMPVKHCTQLPLHTYIDIHNNRYTYRRILILLKILVSYIYQDMSVEQVSTVKVLIMFQI